MNSYSKFLVSMFMLTTFVLYSSDQSNKTMRPLSLGESIFVGGTVGAAEVVLPGQILTYAMNRAIAKNHKVTQNLKQQRPTLREAYRGFTANALGQIPITAVQKVIQVKGSELAEDLRGTKLSDSQKTAISFTAGVGGAVIDTPSNAIQLYLQDKVNAGKKIQVRTALQVLGLKSMRGFVPNAFLKEGPFAVGYQVLAPKCTDLVKLHVDDDLAAKAIGGAVAGVVTAVITQPGAVLRNKMQAEWNNMLGKTAWEVAKTTYTKEGIGGLWRGLPQRGTRVALAVPLYVAYTNLLEQKIKE